MGSLEIEHLEGSKTGTGKHMEKRKGDKFRKQLSEKLERLKYTLHQGKRFRMRPEKLAGMNGTDP